MRLSSFVRLFGALVALWIVSVPAPVSAQGATVSLSADLPAPQPPGTAITWTATPTAGTGTAPHSYKFLYSPTGEHNSSTTIRNWSTSPTFVWTPTTTNLTGWISVWIRSAGNSTNVPEGAATVNFPITTTGVTLGANLAAPQVAGTAIAWTATPSGGVAPHSYRFFVSPDGGANWTMTSDWSTTATWEWQPLNANPNFQVRVWIRSATNATDASEASDNSAFAITMPPAGSGGGGWTFSGSNTVLLTGRAGIGTANPAAKLHVSGDVVVDGNIGAKYQDVAEWVTADEAIPSGTVVIADPDIDNQVSVAVEAYDTAVAGVVSSQPGVLLGVAGPGKVAVAQSGRVLVKVDASFGPIRRGDLLVASPTPGHAMRSEAITIGGVRMHRPGTILGKALGSLDSGQGEVLALLTLQ